MSALDVTETDGPKKSKPYKPRPPKPSKMSTAAQVPADESSQILAPSSPQVPDDAGPRVLPDDVEATHIETHQAAPQPRYKSFRKKYRKMRITFEEGMEEANDLFAREHKAWDIAKRIQESNDQLLDIIHDLELDEAERRGQAHNFAQNPCNLQDLMEEAVYTSTAIVEPASRPTELQELDVENQSDAIQPGYLTTEHELAYLADLDSSLAMPFADNIPTTLEPIPPPLHSRDKPGLREHDFALRNPVSVHNWLRKNKPDLFYERERDKLSERGAKSPAPVEVNGKKSSSKKNTKELDKAADKMEPPSEAFDEVGEANFEVPAKGKRKRDDDTYRPKGGHNRSLNSTRKRKDKEKEDKESAKGSSKKLRTGDEDSTMEDEV